MSKPTICNEVFASTTSPKNSLGPCLSTDDTALYRCLPNLSVPRTKAEIEAMTTRPLLVVNRSKPLTADGISMPFTQQDRMLIRAFARVGSQCPLLIYPCSESEGKQKHAGRGTRSKPVDWKFVRMPKSSPIQKPSSLGMGKHIAVGGKKEVGKAHHQQPQSKQEGIATKSSLAMSTDKEMRSTPLVIQPHEKIPAFNDQHRDSCMTHPTDGNSAMGSQSAFPHQNNGVSFLPPGSAVASSNLDPTNSATSRSMYRTPLGGQPSPIYGAALHRVWTPLCGNTSPFQPMSDWDMYGPTYVHSRIAHNGVASHVPHVEPYSGQGYELPVYEGTSGLSRGHRVPGVNSVYNGQSGSEHSTSTHRPTAIPVPRDGCVEYEYY